MIMDRKKMLLIAYLFPPIGGGGVQRALKMAKYLGNYGWDVVVLTVDGAQHVSLDPLLLKQLPEEVEIYRAREWSIPGLQLAQGLGSAVKSANQGTNRKAAPHQQSASPSAKRDEEKANRPESSIPIPLSRRVLQRAKPVLRKLKEALLIPDDQIIWYYPAVKLGEELIKEQGIDLIFSTSGPYTNHLVAKTLKQKTGLPWIADFRDPWTQNMHRPKLKWRLRLEEKMEREVVEQADVLLTVTKSFARNFRAKYGSSIRHLEVIHNGFDPEDYRQIQSSRLHPEKWTFVYTGIFYQERNPRLFLECVAELIAEGKLDRELISIQFAGVFDYPGYRDNADCVERLGLTDVVHTWGNLPHRNALSLLMGADQLLLIGDVAPDSGAYIPGKLFEYMAVQKPIFALTVEGESSEIIRKLNLGRVIPPFDKSNIKQALQEEYEAWLRGEQRVIQATETSIYQRDQQAKQLAELARRIVE